MSFRRFAHVAGTQPRWSRDADVVVVGSGAAGLTAALTAAERGRRVLLLTKESLGGGSTPFAQGGMAAVTGPDDSFELHARDTMAAGAGLCDPSAVRELVSSAPAVISWLATLGADLGYGHLEGGHSRRRIVHAGGDAVGAEVHRVLSAAVMASSVTVVEHAVALDLVPGGLLAGGLLAGLADSSGVLDVGLVRAGAVVLATGGYGQAYATTTNPAGVTGDGLALAARAGAAVLDVEFMQFHPTVLWSSGAQGQCPLITEALRGAGARVVDSSGRPVLGGRDLAPRDVVAAAMHAVMVASGVDHLYLDATSVGHDVLAGSFPTVSAACLARGIDPAKDPIPVAPGAHYACGGIAADMSGRTSMPGLYAVGEVARTGVHGANRLASNSLTEAMVMARRCGSAVGSIARLTSLERVNRAIDQPGPAAGLVPTMSAVTGVAPSARAGLAAAMSRYAGVTRTRDGLMTLLGLLERAPGSAVLDLATVEATSLHTVSLLVASAALERADSLGCHRWKEAA
jgi:L-aspartate oxidase